MNLKHFLLGCIITAVVTNGEAKFKDVSIDLVRRAAEVGDAQAQTELGIRYGRGDKGVDLNYEKAVYWLRKAIEQEDAYAQYNLGIAYYNGAGVEKDLEQAIDWFRKAGERGIVPAQDFLGYLYASGEGIKKRL